MRIDSRLRCGLAVLALVLGFAPSAAAGCDDLWPADPDSPWVYPWYEVNWFKPLSLESTEDFGNPLLWERFPHGQGPGGATPCQIWAPPVRSEHVYLAFGFEALIRNYPSDAINDHLETGQLYVGGWPIEFDANLGRSPRPLHPANPTQLGDSGFLAIEGGSLRVRGCACASPNNPFGAPAGSPPCLSNNGVECYERIGYRGTYGEIVQSDGVHESANTMSLGLGSSCPPPGTPPPLSTQPAPLCSHGVYRLHGGTFAPRGVACGAQGKGEFEMTSGSYEGAGGFGVGSAYAYGGAIGNPAPPAPLRRIAGHCDFTQSGGVFTQEHSFRVGFGWDDSFAEPVHATGKATISGDAAFSATSLWIGGGDEDFPPNQPVIQLPGGDGKFVQEGGDVSVDYFIAIGVFDESSGKYTINGGNLAQTGCCGTGYQSSLALPKGLHVGLEGHGELIIEGGASTIDVAGVYHQGSDSLVTFKIDGPEEPHITPIEVAETATFEPGAKVKLEVLNGFQPPGNQYFPLLVADEVVGESNLTLDSSSSGQWGLNWTGTNPRILRAIKLYPCGLLGIEPVVLLLALRATRRWRRAQ